MADEVADGGSAAGKRRASSPGLRLSLAIMVAIMGAQGHPAAASGAASGMTCEATGTEVLHPAISDTQACDAFITALHAALAERHETPSEAAEVAIALRFMRSGVVRADVSRNGEDWFDANVAIMDRPLDQRVIAQLADQVAALMTQGGPDDG